MPGNSGRNFLDIITAKTTGRQEGIFLVCEHAERLRILSREMRGSCPSSHAKRPEVGYLAPIGQPDDVVRVFL